MLRQLLFAPTLFTLGGTMAKDAMTKSSNKVDGDLYEPPERTVIIVPTLNEEAFLPITLASLEAQNIRMDDPDRFELVVADSSSEDSTVEIAKDYGATVIDV